MIGAENKTASYKILFDAGGNRYCFFCERSGSVVCTTQPVRADTLELELWLAWNNEGKKQFNFCPTCGKWVCDAMYNPDKLECVVCSPCEKSKQKELRQLGFGTGMMNGGKYGTFR